MVFPRTYVGFGLFVLVGCVNFGDPIVGGQGGRDADVGDSFDATKPPDDVVRACIPVCGGDPWRPVCDPATGTCVGCLADDDCAPTMRGVDGGAVSASRRCDVTRHACVACLGDSDCPAGLACHDGACALGCDDGAPCAGGETCCAGRCVDARRSVSDCGRCGARCEVPFATSLCRDGLCAVGACDLDRADCDGIAGNGCETSLRTVANCGACGALCPAAPHAEPRCEGPTGRCAFACAEGYADCNGRADDGCEVDTTTDVSRCGGCATSCQPPHATGRCVMGACAVAACDVGSADCDRAAANGCETVTASDARNCGACGHACAAMEVCAAGECRSTCAAPRRSCAGECVDVSADARHCGACGAACAAGQSCVAGACIVVCHNQGETACGSRCVLLSSDPTQCGRCGAACVTGPGGRAVCAGGVCAVVCDAGRADCDANAATGCEVDLATSAAHCGRCGAACGLAHATPSCASGRCVIAACGPGFGDCDANPTNGCELDLRADNRNCGACGRTCGVATTCVDGACAPRPGSLDVSGSVTLDPARAGARVSAGSNTVTLSDRVGTFTVGMLVVLHQTRSTTGNAGRYEYARVAAVGASSLTLDARVTSAYVTDAQSHAQVVQVREVTDVLVRAGATLTAPAWDGRTGGILALDASGDVSVAGAVTMDGRGFRGTVRDCAATGRYRCAPGAQGESSTNAGAANSARNGAGGGGGGRGQNCGAGGGGGYGSAGGNGSVGECTIPFLSACSPRCPNPGGQGGSALAAASMATEVHLGAGGEGGADDDGATPGGGGNGGGMILWRVAGRIEVLGEVRADGAAGREGAQSSCGGSGCGMGGGGGGAGGAIRLTAGDASLGVERVHARGGAGANCTCARSGHADRLGGVGGVGRVSVVARALTGVTNPSAER